MSDRIDFVTSLFAVETVAFYDDDEGDFTATGKDVAKQLGEPGDLSISPVSPEGEVSFVWKFFKHGADAFETAPTAVLKNGSKVIACWALSEPVQPSDALTALNKEYDGLIPLPGSEGWDLVYADPDIHYELSDIRVHATPVAAPEVSDDAPWEDDTPTGETALYGVARQITPYDEQDPALAREIVISLGARRESNDWKPKKMPLGAFIAMLCNEHKEGKKDGPSFVGGDMVPGPRKKTAVKALYVATLDIDTGLRTADIDRAVKALGVKAVRYTTHSHGAVETTFPRDTILKKTGAEDLDNAVIRRFLADHQDWDSRIVETATFEGTAHEERGIVAKIAHIAMDKNRVMVPLGEVFDIAKEGATQRDAMAKWGKLLKALAKELNVPLDEACLDPSRLFYFPRHDKGRKYDIAVFGGGLFDWRKLTLDDPFEEEIRRINGESKVGPNTKAGKKLGKWAVNKAHGFQIADALQEYSPEKVRFEKGPGQLEAECPFDDDHSNPGDPEDRGFFVCNAGDGDGDTFFAGCRHDSCQGKRNIDFLGKMIDDGWVPESVLQDPDYNLGEEAVAPEPEPVVVEPEPTPEKTKAKVNDTGLDALRKDKAYRKVAPKIEALRPGAGPDEISEAVMAVLKDEEINGLKRKWVLDLIKARLKVTVGTMNATITACKVAMTKERDKDEESDLNVFEYEGTFHFDEAARVCQNELKRANRTANNKEWGEPLFTCLQDMAMKMRRRTDGRLAFDNLSRDGMWAELNKRVAFVRVADSVQGKREAIPDPVGKQVYEEACDFLPQTPEVIYTPSFKADGSLMTEPKWYYNAKTGENILLHDSGFRINEQVPEVPSIEDVDDALDWLLEEVLGEYPFLDIDTEGVERREPSQANALAMLVTPFMRRMIDGCTPVFFVVKPVAGTGGTMLGKLPLILFDGEDSAQMGYTQSEEEMSKYLVAAVAETRSHLFFDDVKEFNNRVLLRAITARHIGGRLLGSSKTIERPNLFGWVATANNPHVGNEMDRRICWIKLNALVANIQDRKFKARYKVVDGEQEEITYAQWLFETREKTVYSILVLIQNWIAQGKVGFHQRSLVSFEDWAKKVGGVLQAAGVEGFLDNRRMANLDPDEAAVKDFVQRWHEDKKFSVNAVTIKDLFKWAFDQELDILEGNNDDQKKGRFYRKLKSLAGRVFVINEKKYIVMELMDRSMNPVWELREEKDDEIASEVA